MLKKIANDERLKHCLDKAIDITIFVAIGAVVVVNFYTFIVLFAIV